MSYRDPLTRRDQHLVSMLTMKKILECRPPILLQSQSQVSCLSTPLDLEEKVSSHQQEQERPNFDLIKQHMDQDQGDMRVLDTMETEHTKNTENIENIKIKDAETKYPIKNSFSNVKMDSTNKDTALAATNGNIKITSDVFTTNEIKHLIQIDGEVFAFADSEAIGLEIIKSVCTVEVKRYEKPDVKVFQRVLKDGKEVHICTQELGYVMNSGIKKKEIITLTPVPRAILIQAPIIGAGMVCTEDNKCEWFKK